MKKYISSGLAAATGVFLYVLGVAWFMHNGARIFGETEDFLIPVFMLLLLVISAAITGSLVLGRPIVLYLDNHKKQALWTLVSTLFFLMLFATGLIIVLSLR